MFKLSLKVCSPNLRTADSAASQNGKTGTRAESWVIPMIGRRWEAISVIALCLLNECYRNGAEWTLRVEDVHRCLPFSSNPRSSLRPINAGRCSAPFPLPFSPSRSFHCRILKHCSRIQQRWHLRTGGSWLDKLPPFVFRVCTERTTEKWVCAVRLVFHRRHTLFHAQETSVGPKAPLWILHGCLSAPSRVHAQQDSRGALCWLWRRQTLRGDAPAASLCPQTHGLDATATWSCCSLSFMR